MFTCYETYYILWGNVRVLFVYRIIVLISRRDTATTRFIIQKLNRRKNILIIKNIVGSRTWNRKQKLNIIILKNKVDSRTWNQNWWLSESYIVIVMLKKKTTWCNDVILHPFSHYYILIAIVILSSYHMFPGPQTCAVLPGYQCHWTWEFGWLLALYW